MHTPQGIEPWRSGGGGDPAHASACLRLSTCRIPCVGAILGLLTLGLAAGAQAQTRGDMQVGAQVLMAAPSQAALASALNRPITSSLSVLADIRRDRKPVARDSTGAALPPRSIITIAFLRN